MKTMAVTGAAQGLGLATASLLARRGYRVILADSDREGFINGVSLPVDGGWIADASSDSLRLRTRS